ncbi:hypothetical protein AB837_00614 [bacterium AB1]|nr:hypothetical protein AB837_00614 [bacterium AB1]
MYTSQSKEELEEKIINLEADLFQSEKQVFALTQTNNDLSQGDKKTINIKIQKIHQENYKLKKALEISKDTLDDYANSQRLNFLDNQDLRQKNLQLEDKKNKLTEKNKILNEENEKLKQENKKYLEKEAETLKLMQLQKEKQYNARNFLIIIFSILVLLICYLIYHIRQLNNQKLQHQYIIN